MNIKEHQVNNQLSDFYVISQDCIACGVPQQVAPDLVVWNEDGLCVWKKQPENSGDLKQALDVFDAQCCGAHYYRGTDPAIQRRVGFSQCAASGSSASSALRSIFAVTKYSAAFWKRLRPGR